MTVKVDVFVQILAPGATKRLSYMAPRRCSLLTPQNSGTQKVDPYRKSGELPSRLACHAFILHRVDVAWI